jgi:hypothetical protein
VAEVVHARRIIHGTGKIHMILRPHPSRPMVTVATVAGAHSKLDTVAIYDDNRQDFGGRLGGDTAPAAGKRRPRAHRCRGVRSHPSRSGGDMATTHEDWYAFLADIELAKSYQKANVRHAGTFTPNPVVDTILPALLYVKMGCIVDHFFKNYILSRGWGYGKYKKDFNGRISLMAERGCLLDAERLHRFRNDRNKLAHEPWQYCSWDELDDATNAVHAELQHLELAGPRPAFEFFSERRPSSNPEPGAISTQDYCYGLRDRGNVVVEVSWTSVKRLNWGVR